MSYYLKRPELLVPIAAGLVNGAAHRQIARLVGCSPSTVTRLAARLGRHALLLQALSLRHLPADDAEDTVLDHFESFEGSRHEPVAIATLVGRESWFVYGLEGCTHARTGRRSRIQEQRRRLRPRRESKGGYVGSSARLLALRLGRWSGGAKLRLVSDDLAAYRHALRRRDLRGRFEHLVFPNPERGPKGTPRSTTARLRDRAMFPNDLLHSLVRHCLAHHHRKTIAFPRRAVAALERAFLFSVWRNFIKGVSERLPDPTTPAIRKGLSQTPWTWCRLLARRLFPQRIPLSPSWTEIYRRDWTTPTLRSNTRHRLHFAY